jgi:hypothetical protein
MPVVDFQAGPRQPAHEALKDARSVAIVGAGAVGTELPTVDIPMGGGCSSAPG